VPKAKQHQLSGQEKKYLRGLAHRLKPVVYIGQKGITGMLVRALDEALESHELIKVKFIEFKEKQAKPALCQILEKQLDCQLAGLIGHTALFYRPHPEAEKRKIVLPQKKTQTKS
jgi:RNA-binding protein